MYFLRDPSDMAIFSNTRDATIFVESTGSYRVGVTMRCGTRATQASIPPQGCLFLNLVSKPDICFLSLWQVGDVSAYACFNDVL